ncbi:DUF5590 domain-containing protein [Metabacillus litoralis]|uniref:cell wall elongation regulator TseB-like domain-containing protein n=1 Tax=Metabacillus litoralis TaxID=152268 RepID=UPI001CFEE2F3|nr:DUF5590 domain-containing protein [Metabacillus litoralis]
MGKKTIITLVIIFILIITSIWVFGSIYNTARNQYKENHQSSKELAMEKADLTTVESINTFNGNQKYHVISGENAKNEEVYVWIPQPQKENNKENDIVKNIVVEKHSSGVTRDEAIQVVQNEYKVKKLINVQLGMDEGIPIWEVKYKDQSDRYTFDFVHFSNGEIIKHMALKNNKFK